MKNFLNWLISLLCEKPYIYIDSKLKLMNGECKAVTSGITQQVVHEKAGGELFRKKKYKNIQIKFKFEIK